jgi:hypothetical protein
MEILYFACNFEAEALAGMQLVFASFDLSVQSAASLGLATLPYDPAAEPSDDNVMKEELQEPCAQGCTIQIQTTSGHLPIRDALVYTRSPSRMSMSSTCIIKLHPL